MFKKMSDETTGELLVLARRTDGHQAYFTKFEDTWYRIPACACPPPRDPPRVVTLPAGPLALWPSLPDADLWDVVQIITESEEEKV